MSERPPIPAELRRRVLVEAGHRCAIHTCRHVEVDLHHIQPWSQCREHRFENLIALCPNCHRLAEEGKIDRKSLRLYKARLAAAFRFQEVNLYPEETVLPTGFAWVDPSGEWWTNTIANAACGVEASFEYPVFSNRILGGAAGDVNRHFQDYVDGLISRFLTATAPAPKTDGPEWYLQGSFSITLLRQHILSVRFTAESFTGGMHGALETHAQNVITNPVRELAVEKLFTNPVAGLKAISEYSIRELLRPVRDRVDRDEQWVRTGASADPKNFASLNLTNRGILVTFDEYQVGSYAEGSSEVHIPYEAVIDELDPAVASAVRGE